MSFYPIDPKYKNIFLLNADWQDGQDSLPVRLALATYRTSDIRNVVFVSICHWINRDVQNMFAIDTTWN